MERNYRSTAPIVDAANLLIQHNQNRTDKKLVNETVGNVIECTWLGTPEDEGKYISDIALLRKLEGKSLADIAVLARTNGQLAFIKEHLTEAKITATVVNRDADPLKRTDIKKLISFLNLVVNPKDEKALWSCLNFPQNRMTDLEKATFLSETDWSSERALDIMRTNGNANVRAFTTLIDTLRNSEEIKLFDISAYEALKQASYALGLKSLYEQKGLQNRVADMMAALRYTRWWCNQQVAAGERNNIEAFLKWLRIRDIQDFYRKDEDTVQLLTVHGSKGLEFETVILVGMNEGSFPSKQTEDMEEERRLAYVAITRAKRRLYLTRPCAVPLYGKKTYEALPSRFVREMGL